MTVENRESPDSGLVANDAGRPTTPLETKTLSPVDLGSRPSPLTSSTNGTVPTVTGAEPTG